MIFNNIGIMWVQLSELSIEDTYLFTHREMTLVFINYLQQKLCWYIFMPMKKSLGVFGIYYIPS